MLIDTHCHLDAAEFDADREQVADEAREAGVQSIVIPAIERANFPVVRELAGGQLVARRIVNPGLSTRLMLATASSRPLTQAVKIVQGILRELLEALASSEPYRAYMRMAGARAGAG